MNIAIIGSGLIGNKRAASIEMDDKIVAIYDTNMDAMVKMASTYKTEIVTDINDVMLNSEIECIIIAVVNKHMKNYAVDALKAGKHVLCEKPLGLNATESRTIVDLARLNKCLVKTGFNHRFHPGLRDAKKLIDAGKIGKILNIRAHYGHGGRPGMESEWRCSKELCGGGELLDQGVHLIDLCRWLTDLEVLEVSGKVATSFWDIEVEDNAYFNLFFENNTIAQCHVSWTNWRNSFVFEIFGYDGYIKISGLGGSYGTETLECGIRNPKGGKPAVKITEYSVGDNSWLLEWKDFKSAIQNRVEPLGNGYDGLMANMIVEKIYHSSSSNSVVSL
jgi:predicted dehydrogenase